MLLSKTVVNQETSQGREGKRNKSNKKAYKNRRRGGVTRQLQKKNPTIFQRKTNAFILLERIYFEGNKFNSYVPLTLHKFLRA